MKLNVKQKQDPVYTHEGGKAVRTNALYQLRRSVLTCMLWENSFYEDGQSIADRIKSLVPQVNPIEVARLAIQARELMKLRHVPLLLVREMARLPQHKQYVAETLGAVIQRPDELTEFLAIYWADGKQPLSAQVKKGLALAFTKFNEYQLGKYNSKSKTVSLRDVLFLSHAKPLDYEQAMVWERLVNGTLATPDTWEVQLSAGKDKRSTWERLIRENKLGALALLRNLRNMKEAGVDKSLIVDALGSMKASRVLPFRFIAAAKHAPQWEQYIEPAMLQCLEGREQLKGHTVILVDISGSMNDNVSAKSDLTRVDAAYGLAILARELCEDVSIYSFSSKLVQVPARRGFALRDAIEKSQPHGSTYLGNALRSLNESTTYDRIIVITDEQSSDHLAHAPERGYLINVAAYANGVGRGRWVTISGWSEAVFDFIIEEER